MDRSGWIFAADQGWPYAGSQLSRMDQAVWLGSRSYQASCSDQPLQRRQAVHSHSLLHDGQIPAVSNVFQ
jgi:hypothetical protein